MTAYERTGWRDEALSRRHREWGYDCPAADVDFVLVEYDTGIPAAIVDYKRRTSQLTLAEQASNVTALGGLHAPDGRQLPFIVCYYDSDTWAMRFLPMNEAAIRLCAGSSAIECDERGWVQWLHYWRGRVADERLLATRNTIGWNEEGAS